MKSKLPFLLACAAAALVPAFGTEIDIEIRLGRSMPPPPPEVILVDPSGPYGPPPWAAAPSHWYRRSYDYYYYPGANIYYRPSDHYWFFMEGRSWRSVRQLPSGISVDFYRSVPLRLDSDRPYTYHERVVSAYPSNYFTRVKFKNDRDDHRGGQNSPGQAKDHHDQRPDDDHGKDKDHGGDKDQGKRK